MLHQVPRASRWRSVVFRLQQRPLDHDHASVMSWPLIIGVNSRRVGGLAAVGGVAARRLPAPVWHRGLAVGRAAALACRGDVAFMAGPFRSGD